MNIRHAVTAVCIVAIALLSACAKGAVEDYFSAALANRAPYKVAGVTGYELRSYKILQATSEVASVELTFAGKLGNDVVHTRKFLRRDGKLRATDRSDIRAAIIRNLELISAGAGALALEDFGQSDKKITYERLRDAKLFPAGLASYDGEDYAKVTITKIPSKTNVVGSLELSVVDSMGESIVWSAP